MSEYSVVVTNHAWYSMAEIRDYIAFKLSNPGAAARYLQLFRKEIKRLSDHPGKYKLIDDPPWHDKGIRKVRVKHYYIYYWISEDEHAVYVTDVIYAGSDQMKWLDQMPMK